MIRKTINWNLFSIINLIVIIYCSFFIVPGTSEIPSIIPHIDKIGHFLLYASQALGIKMTLFNSNFKNYNRLTLIICFFIGLLIEVLQPILTMNRLFDFFDILANIVGATLTISILKPIKK